jgi:hypothetical protein
MEKAISLSGFMINVKSSTENRLEIEVDATSLKRAAYKKLVESLEAILTDIDKKYSARKGRVRGRSLPINLGGQTLRFSPFPSKFSNTLSNARTLVYALVADYCVLLEEIGRGKVYLLPKGVAPEFLEEIERVNQETTVPLREEIAKFMRSDDFHRIEKCMSDSGILFDFHVSTLGNAIDDFSVDIMPVDFGYKYSNINADYTLERGKRLKAQLDRKEREYRINIAKDITGKINELVGQPVIGPRLVPRIDRLARMCDSLGLFSISEKVLKPLREIVAARPSERAGLCEKHFGCVDLKRGVEATLKASFGG